MPSPSQDRTAWVLGGVIIAVALLLRVGVGVLLFENLADDRDAYLGIANTIVAGNGFSSPGSDQPTAFRPPLYPIVIAAISPLGMQLGLAIAHVVLGVMTVILTMRLGQKLGLGRFSLLAGLLVCVNPLLLLYTSYPMTETLFTFLVITWLNLVVGAEGNNVIASGILFGLAALCRPTILAFAPLIGFWLLVKNCWVAGVEQSSPAESQLPTGLHPPTSNSQTKGWLIQKLIPIGITVLILAPWTIRNQIHFGKPIFATTHGGYTLLLGNNPVFYTNVVRQPWGTTWGDWEGVDRKDGEILTQSQWLQHLEEDMKADSITGEVARDSWMYRRAFKDIQADPSGFLMACRLRFVRFWNVIPLGPEARSKPAILMGAVGLFYAVVLLAAFIGVVRLVWSGGFWSHETKWAVPLLFCLSMTIVHLFYWSNLRMRAPLEPVLALLAMHGISPFSRPALSEK